jgi:hypothetical protein
MKIIKEGKKRKFSLGTIKKKTSMGEAIAEIKAVHHSIK